MFKIKFIYVLLVFLLVNFSTSQAIVSENSTVVNNPIQVIPKYESVKYGPADSIFKIKRYLQSLEYKDSLDGVIYIAIQITKDKVPVVYSQDSLDQFPDFQGHAKHYTFDELQSINLGYNFSDMDNNTNSHFTIEKLEDFMPLLKEFITDKPGNLIVFELKDSSMSPASTLYLLSEYFSIEMLNNITFNSKVNKYKSLLSYYNYLYASSQQLPVVCDIPLSEIVSYYKTKNKFLPPTEIDQCTTYGSTIIDFNYSELNSTPVELTQILMQYIKYIHADNPQNKIFLDIKYNLSEEMKQMLGTVKELSGILIDTDANPPNFASLSIEEGYRFIQQGKKPAIVPKPKRPVKKAKRYFHRIR